MFIQDECLSDLRKGLAEAPADPLLMAVTFGAVQAAFEDLDAWLSNGGSLPADWKR